ncbi:MAG: alpha/beta hydrolase [Geobacteraceae bacterium]|nr:alpha/beta hydrolase [Geobacteraceae bacterium]
MPWFENAAGNRLWYEEYGAGTPILFIHGWCMSSAVWGFQREGLSNFFRVITLDLQGHGKSSVCPDGFQIKGCAGDIVELIEHLGLNQAILAGWSLGAQIAIEVSQLNTERVSGLVLISGTPRFVQTHDFPHGLSRLEVEGMAKKVYRNIHRAVAGFITRMFACGEDRSVAVGKLLSSVSLPTPETALQALEALVEADMLGCLARINCPTLILHGDCDLVCLPQASEFMEMQVPMSHRIVFAGCGHVPFLTQSSKFNACLEDFCGRVSAGTYRQE